MAKPTPVSNPTPQPSLKGWRTRLAAMQSAGLAAREAIAQNDAARAKIAAAFTLGDAAAVEEMATLNRELTALRQREDSARIAVMEVEGFIRVEQERLAEAERARRASLAAAQEAVLLKASQKADIAMEAAAQAVAVVWQELAALVKLDPSANQRAGRFRIAVASAAMRSGLAAHLDVVHRNRSVPLAEMVGRQPASTPDAERAA